MILRAMLDVWRMHQGIFAALVGFIVMGIAWASVLLGYRTPAGRRTPLHWYVGHNPPPIHDPANWDLREFNRVYTRASATGESRGDPPTERG